MHELPILSDFSEDILAAANVVTVEPGVYLAGKGGVRIEDLVIVEEDGAEVLTPFTKDLLTLGLNWSLRGRGRSPPTSSETACTSSSTGRSGASSSSST